MPTCGTLFIFTGLSAGVGAAEMQNVGPFPGTMEAVPFLLPGAMGGTKMVGEAIGETLCDEALEEALRNACSSLALRLISVSRSICFL